MMKAGIEAGDLGRVGHAFEDYFDEREVVRLMERRERDELFQIDEDLLIHARGFEVMHSSVHDAMPHSDECHVAPVFAQESGEMFDGPLMPQFDAVIPMLFADDLAVTGFADEMGRSVEPFDLTPKGQVESTVSPSEDRKFEAGGTGIENQNRIRHSNERLRGSIQYCQFSNPATSGRDFYLLSDRQDVCQGENKGVLLAERRVFARGYVPLKRQMRHWYQSIAKSTSGLSVEISPRKAVREIKTASELMN